VAELWVKRVGGRVWRAMARAVPSRLWRGGRHQPPSGLVADHRVGPAGALLCPHPGPLGHGGGADGGDVAGRLGVELLLAPWESAPAGSCRGLLEVAGVHPSHGGGTYQPSVDDAGVAVLPTTLARLAGTQVSGTSAEPG
jgi:hypothetical protein